MPGLLSDIYHDRNFYELMNLEEKGNLERELQFLRKKAKLMETMMHMLDHLRDVRLEFFAKEKLIEKEGHLHELLHRQQTKRGFAMDTRMKNHMALRKVFQTELIEQDAFREAQWREARYTMVTDNKEDRKPVAVY